MTEIEEAPGYGSPVRPIRYIVENDDEIGYVNRIIVGTPTRGSVRIEWHSAVRGLMVPPNWSMVTMPQQMSPYIPLRFQVADAQNLIVAKCLELDFEWLLLLEDDVVPPVDLFVKLNDYMREGQVPVVSGLYYLKSEPSEPIIYRGAGTGSFHDFELGEKVWADGVPTGCLLIHHAILRTMWDDSEEYNVGSQTVRMVFQSPAKSWMDPETRQRGHRPRAPLTLTGASGSFARACSRGLAGTRSTTSSTRSSWTPASSAGTSPPTVRSSRPTGPFRGLLRSCPTTSSQPSRLRKSLSLRRT